MNSPNSRRDVLLFGLDELRCAVDAAPVLEVVRAVTIRQLPGQPSFVAGVIDLRGRIVPVLDLRSRLGLRTKELALSDHFIITISRERRVALWVDAVDDVMALDWGAFVPAEGLIVGTRSLAGVARGAEGLLLIHDLSAFLTESEADALSVAGVGT
jgi:purine-binding chemotaxis protein CheW